MSNYASVYHFTERGFAMLNLKKIALFAFIILGINISAYCADLESAAYNGDKQKVIQILKTKPDINHRDSFGGTALHGAMFQKDLSIIEMLLDYGFDPNAKGIRNGYTPLHDAVWATNIDAVKLLLRRGAKPDIKNNDGLTAYSFAKNNGKNEIAKYIKEYSEKKNLSYE